MNHNFLKFALGISFTAAAFSANAQKAYTEGVANYTLTSPMGDVEYKVSFRGDSSKASFQSGPAQVQLLSTAKGNFFAVVVDVPIASMKKVAVANPDDLEQAAAAAPKFTFTPTTETKMINGFNCKKVMVKDAKSGSSFDAWVTTDIKAPQNTLSRYFDEAGGFPVQYTTIQMGAQVGITLKSISAEKVPAGSFGIPAGYDRITMEELASMRGN